MCQALLFKLPRSWIIFCHYVVQGAAEKKCLKYRVQIILVSLIGVSLFIYFLQFSLQGGLRTTLTTKPRRESCQSSGWLRRASTSDGSPRPAMSGCLVSSRFCITRKFPSLFAGVTLLSTLESANSKTINRCQN